MLFCNKKIFYAERLRLRCGKKESTASRQCFCLSIVTQFSVYFFNLSLQPLHRLPAWSQL